MRLMIRRVGSALFGTSDTIEISAGAGSAGKVAHLGVTGKYHSSVLPDTLGAVDAVTQSAGAGDVGKTVLLDAAGSLDKSVLPFNLANANVDFHVYFTAGAPVDYTDGSPPATGEGVAGIGSLAIDVTGGKLYVNGGTKAHPIWKLVTSAA